MGWRARPPAPSAARAIAALSIAAIAAALVSWRTPAAAQAPATSPPPADSTARAPMDTATHAPADTAAQAPPTPVFRPAEWETLYTGLPEATHLSPLVRARYNRVDGPALLLGGAVVSEREIHPLLYASAGYAFSRERFLYDAGFDAPLGDHRRFRVSGSAYRRTATEDEWIVGETENTLFALFARTDYRDHYEAEGVEGGIAWEPGRDFALSVGAVKEDVRSLETETKFSIFGKDDEFRANPPIQDGQQGVFSVSGRIGPSTIPIDGGTSGDLTYERAGSPIDGDSEYERVRGAVHTNVRLSPRQTARARVIGGATLDGDLPPQKDWHVGGISTLRGHGYKDFSGDQLLLANAEYYLLARKNVWAFAFLDWGAAWFGKDNLSRQQFALDGGVGIRLGAGPIAMTVARNLQRSDAPILVGVRLGGTF
jgi:surface antigen Omp85-like protein